MKIKIFIYGILITCCSALFFSSCYDDKSTLATNFIDEVLIDTTGIKKEQFIGYQELLTIEPTITVGGSDGESRLQYEWALAYFSTSNSEFEVISTDKALSEVISRPISSAPYTLKLTVTDTANDNLQYLCLWNVYVQSSFLDGLLISDTKDGATSDLTLILNNQLTINYDKEEKVYRQILEKANGAPYSKLMTALTYEKFGNALIAGSGINQVWAITDDGNCIRFNTQDFSINGTSYSDDESIITYKPAGLEFISLFRAYQMFFAYTTEGFYSFMNVSVNSFGWYDAVMTGYMPDNGVIAATSSSSVYYNHTVWLDQVRGAFYSYSGSASFGASVGNYQSNMVFDPNAMADQTAVAAGIKEDGSIATFLLKEKNSGSYAIYTLGQYREAEGFYDDNWNWTETAPATPASARNKYLIPDEGKLLLDNAVSIFFAQRENVLYVVTANGIYTILYGSGDTAVVSTVAKYAPTAGETITSAKLYQQGHQTNDNATTTGTPPFVTPLEWNNKAIIVTTQKGEYEGKVYVMPITQTGIGTLDPSKALAYDGFGRILDVITIGY
jgi:hypothetical protein